jgi:hypothetical protein
MTAINTYIEPKPTPVEARRLRSFIEADFNRLYASRGFVAEPFVVRNIQLDIAYLGGMAGAW